MFVDGVVCVCVWGGGADDSCEPECGRSRRKYRQSIYVIRAVPVLVNYEEYKLLVVTSS